MSRPDWERDAPLLSDLHEALTGDVPSPAEFTESAVAAYAIGRPDAAADLAELVFDSACDPPPAGAARSLAAGRLLAFRSERFDLDVEIGPDGLLGQVYLHDAGIGPVAGGSIAAESVPGAVGLAEAAALDEVGGFTLPLPPPGPVRLRVRLPGGLVVTSWLVLRY